MTAVVLAFLAFIVIALVWSFMPRPADGRWKSFRGVGYVPAGRPPNARDLETTTITRALREGAIHKPPCSDWTNCMVCRAEANRIQLEAKRRRANRVHRATGDQPIRIDSASKAKRKRKWDQRET